MTRTPNAEQAKVIAELDNNIILFASAGTGKTFTVANRVANILKSGRAKAEEILCLTFTIKACDEMKEDIAGYVGEEAKDVRVKTIHGFCHQVLSEESKRVSEKYCEPTVCDEVDQEEILKSILSSRIALWEQEALLGVETGEGEAEESSREFFIYRKRGALRELLSGLKHCREAQGFFSEDEEEDFQRAFEYLKENEREKYERLVSCSLNYGGPDAEFAAAMERFAGRLAWEYERHLKQSNQVDFDDLILLAKAHLNDGETCARWRERFRYIIVDEMQDTSRLEYSVLKKLFSGNNVMLCGDFFQTIYEWRGSKPSEVLSDYVSEFSAVPYMLSENYRSTRLLARAGFGYLKKTYPELIGRYCPKELKIKSESEGDKILCYGFDNREEEAYRIYKYIARLKREGEPDVCVMARSNKYIAELVRYFEAFNAEANEGERLRFFTVEENCQFFKKPVIKDVLAVVKLLLSKDDRVSMERIAERYVKNVGVGTIGALRAYNELGVSIVSFIDPELYLHGDTYHSLVEGYNEENIVVYDTETTGLDLMRDEIVQISAIKIGRDGAIKDVLDIMVEPTVPIGAEAQKTHGFDLDYIRSHGGVTAKEALARFSAFVKGSVLVGHNSLRFDSPLIRRQLKENGLPEIEIRAEYDTMTIAGQFHARFPDFKLKTLCFHYGVVNECAHNAFGDIKATGECLVRMILEDIIPTALERQRLLAKYKERFERFYAFVAEFKEKIKTYSPAELIKGIIERMGLVKENTPVSDRNALGDLVESLQGEGTENPEAFLKEYLLNASLSGSQMDTLIKKLDRVPVITVHQAKGCEFDTVILAGVDENRFPSFAARQSGNEDEEKKVFYVAITRAKKRLVLTRSLGEGRYSQRESPYFWNIPADCVSANSLWDAREEL